MEGPKFLSTMDSLALTDEERRKVRDLEEEITKWSLQEVSARRIYSGQRREEKLAEIVSKREELEGQLRELHEEIERRKREDDIAAVGRGREERQAGRDSGDEHDKALAKDLASQIETAERALRRHQSTTVGAKTFYRGSSLDDVEEVRLKRELEGLRRRHADATGTTERAKRINVERTPDGGFFFPNHPEQVYRNVAEITGAENFLLAVTFDGDYYFVGRDGIRINTIPGKKVEVRGGHILFYGGIGTAEISVIDKQTGKPRTGSPIYQEVQERADGLYGKPIRTSSRGDFLGRFAEDFEKIG